jgi:hypothetical protein
LSENCFELVGRGGWPPISTWIIEGGKFIMEFETTRNSPNLNNDTMALIHNIKSQKYRDLASKTNI